MRNVHMSSAHEHCIDNSEEALERLLEWSESTYSCDRLSPSDLLAKAEESSDPLRLELASRYAAMLGL